MATCRQVFLYACICILISKSLKAESSSRNVCLQKAMTFLGEKKFPNFTVFKRKKAVGLFSKDNSVCNDSCTLQMVGLSDNANAWNYLRSVILTFNNSNNIISSNQNSGVDFFFNCSLWNKEQVGVFWTNYCNTKDSDCFKLNRFCVCRCYPGYLMINGHCLRGNITVGKACVSHLQCTGSQYSELCTDGKCVYNRGYMPFNNSYKRELTRNDLGLMIGALFGGLLLGVIITSGTAYLIYKRSRYSIDKRKEPGVMYAVIDTFDDIRDGDNVQNKASTKNNKDKQKKVLNVSLLTRSQELPEYSNASGKEPAMTNMDDVYNHLYEKGETQDDDTYDHAGPAAERSHLRDLDDYSNIHALDDGTVVSGGTEDEDYSTLEHN